MFIENLLLANFRNYEYANIDFHPGTNILLGKNGQGKTNLVEAINYFSTLSSHRIHKDSSLIKFGSDTAKIRGKICYKNMQTLLEIEISANKTNKAKINQGNINKIKDILGIAKTVIFSPEDLSLIKGEPFIRRKFIDELVNIFYPNMSARKIEYDRIIKHRNTLLRSNKNTFRDNKNLLDLLAVWNVSAAQVGSKIILSRINMLRKLEPHIKVAYKNISSDFKESSIKYSTNIDKICAENIEDQHDITQIEAMLLYSYESVQKKEIERGLSLIGPHRDDIEFLLNDNLTKDFASHGESWSFSLALKLASYDLIKSFGDNLYGDPILILDDVFAELDLQRRYKLADIVGEAEQVFITSAVSTDIPKNLHGESMIIESGKVIF